MKNGYVWLWWAALALCCAAGCSHEGKGSDHSNAQPPLYNRVLLSVEASGEGPGAESRTELEQGRWMKWLSGDRIGVWIDAANANIPLTTTFAGDADASYGLFTGVVQTPAEGALVHAYYPYGENDAIDAAGAVLTLDDEQLLGAADRFEGRYCPMVGVPAPVEKREGEHVVRGMRFRMLASIIRFNVYGAAYAGEKVRSLRLDASTPVAGRIFCATLTAGGEFNEVELREGVKAITVRMEGDAPLGADTESGAALYMNLFAGEHLLDKVTVRTDKAIYVLTLTQRAFTAQRARLHLAGIDLSRAERTPLEALEYLREEFDGCTGTNNAAPVSGSVFKTSDYGTGVSNADFATSGWSYTKCYQGAGCLKLGTSSSDGSLTTPELAKISGTRDIILRFNAYNWETSPTQVRVTASTGTPEQEAFTLPAGAGANNTIPAGTGIESMHYSVRIAGADPTTRLTFAGAARFFLDEIVVCDAELLDDGTQGGGGGDGGDPPVVVPSEHAWAELPAELSGTDYLHVTHTVPSTSMRNYSFCYDITRRAALWVAYPMHVCYDGSSGRTEAWAYDPAVPSEYQPYLKNSYTGNYSRGHQIASGDRQVSEEANRMTFYYSNMTPQIQIFNGNIWASLEKKVQDTWICSDTLYVVTGCYFDPASSVTTSDRSGNVCPVPSHYFKVVARSRLGATGQPVAELSASQLICAGFWFDHFKSYSTKDKVSASDMRSVAEIERLTGLTFFPNIPALDKTACNASDWGL